MLQRKEWAILFAVLALVSCSKIDPESAIDPLPMPAEMEKNKDLSVAPGDSFYDYCLGTWLKNTPIPENSPVGGMYDQDVAMRDRVEELKASVPDIARFYELMSAESGQPEASKAFLEGLKARFERPKTRDEALITLGKMIADGIPVWGNPLIPAWGMAWKDGRMVGVLSPPIVFTPMNTTGTLADVDPARLVPLPATRAVETGSDASLILQGMGQDPSLFYIDPIQQMHWDKLADASLEDLCRYMDAGWANLEQFSREQLTDANRAECLLSNAYTLSYHIAQNYVSPATKEQFVGIAKEIQASLRRRIQQVDWMSEATRNNALDKLDGCALNVGYPDAWYEDCLPRIQDCATLTEAVYLQNQALTRLKGHLLGGQDTFSYLIITASIGSTSFVPSDLTVVNAFYNALNNAIYIYPAFMIPPILPDNVSLAYAYAIFASIGHELTHGFDSSGAQYDKFGNKRNWWTVADKMAFEERCELLVACHNHMEIDPLRAPGLYNDGSYTLTENIADLGGFLVALDAYKARLEADGYRGEEMDKQLRKFYESFADLWKVQYSDAKFAQFPKKDVHSHARLRVNGVVMNTDLWYDLYDVDRNNNLYLPKERRAYIW